jgi:hypothetical protein
MQSKCAKSAAKAVPRCQGARAQGQTQQTMIGTI